MQLSDAITLINSPQLYSSAKSTWADLGCGTGLFTRALSTLLAPHSSIHAVDKVPLQTLPDQHHYVDIIKCNLDFVKEEWPFHSLRGILMANSLHYVKDQLAFIHKAEHYLAENGCFVLVEYDTDSANPWVPYPLSLNSLKKLFMKAGYSSVLKIGEYSSAYNGKMYGVAVQR